VIDELDAGGHYLLGSAEFLIKNDVTTHKQVGLYFRSYGNPKRRLMEEIQARKLQDAGAKALQKIIEVFKYV